jgi:hypothetical protein
VTIFVCFQYQSFNFNCRCIIFTFYTVSHNVYITICCLHAGSQPKIKSELLYDWRFTANEFVLASSPLRLTTEFFFLFHSTFRLIILTQHALWREDWVISYEYSWPLVKCMYRTYITCILSKIRPCTLYKSALWVQVSKADHTCLTYRMLQRQLSHIK